jgi:hypothetical protein
MSEYHEEHIARQLRALPSPPRGWVEAAQQLPRARAEIDGLAARARADAEFRVALLADLEAALAAEGVEPRAALVELLRRRVSE